MKVYDPEQDRQKSFFHKLYEMIVGGLAHGNIHGALSPP